MAASSLPRAFQRPASRISVSGSEIARRLDEDWGASLKESLPLLVLGAVCLALGLVVFPFGSGSTAPVPYLGLLFLVVGCIAAAGGVASLFAREIPEDQAGMVPEGPLATTPAPLTAWEGVVHSPEGIDWIGERDEPPSPPPVAPTAVHRDVHPAQPATGIASSAPPDPGAVPAWHEGPPLPEPASSPALGLESAEAELPLSTVIDSLEAIVDSVRARSGMRPDSFAKPVECEQCGRELLGNGDVPHCQSCGRILCPSCRDLHEGSGGEGLCMECALLYDSPSR